MDHGSDYESSLRSRKTAKHVGIPGQGLRTGSPSTDNTGPAAPQNTQPAGRVTATHWGDQGTLCYQVNVDGILVGRRQDNLMINGINLLRVAAVSQFESDCIFEAEKVKHVVHDGPLHLKGVWIPFGRALELADLYGITDLLYPLFVFNISSLLHQPTNQRTTLASLSQEESQEHREISAQLFNTYDSHPDFDSSRADDLSIVAARMSTTRVSPRAEYILVTNPNRGSERRTAPQLMHKAVDSAEDIKASGHNSADRNSKDFNDASPIGTEAKSDLNPWVGAWFEEENRNESSSKLEHGGVQSEISLLSRTDNSNVYGAELVEGPEKGKGVEMKAAGLSPSQESPQSDSESSSESTPGLLTRDERKVFLLDRLMEYFTEMFASCHSPVPFIVAMAGSGGAGSSGTGRSIDGHQNTSDDASRSRKASKSGARASRKRELEKDGDDDDQRRDQDQPGKRAREEVPKRAASRKLACPYFKKDPDYPQLARSCSGPGWDTVHRVKEHLDRNHALQPSCDRCYKAFKTDADRTAHLRSEVQCPLREQPSRMQGFDASQKDQLKGRPRGYKQMSEIQKWCHIFAILFPETDKADIPSPYYNYGSFHDPGHPVDLMVEYDQFLRRELPDRVRHQLEILIEDALHPVEDTLRGQIVDIVREVQNELSESFRNSIGTVIRHSHPDPENADTEADKPEIQLDENEDNDDWESNPRAAEYLPNLFGPGQSSLENMSESHLPGLSLDNLIRNIDYELFDFSLLIDLPGTQDSVDTIVQEEDNDSLLPGEWSLI